MNRTLTNLFLAALAISGASLAGPDDTLKGITLELKGRSIPENSIEFAVGNEAPANVSAVVVGLSAEETAEAFDAAMLLEPSKIESVGVALVAHELAHTVQQSAGSKELVAHELTHVVQQSAGNRELVAHELAHVVQQAAQSGDPGVIHVIVWDYLGILHPATAYDRTWDDEVWNQPLSVREAALTVVLEMLTNTQKSKHDAAMAAIQNTR